MGDGQPWNPLSIAPPGGLMNMALVTTAAAIGAQVSQTFTVPTGKMWWLLAGGAIGLDPAELNNLTLEATADSIRCPIGSVGQPASVAISRLGVQAPAFYVLTAGDTVHVSVLNGAAAQDIRHLISFREFDVRPLI